MLHTMQASMMGHFQNRNLKCRSMHFKLYGIFMINRVTVVGGRAQFLTRAYTHIHRGSCDVLDTTWSFSCTYCTICSVLLLLINTHKSNHRHTWHGFLSVHGRQQRRSLKGLYWRKDRRQDVESRPKGGRRRWHTQSGVFISRYKTFEFVFLTCKRPHNMLFLHYMFCTLTPHCDYFVSSSLFSSRWRFCNQTLKKVENLDSYIFMK